MGVSASDHAGVRFPPPLIFLGFIGLGFGLDQWFGIGPLNFAEWLRWTATTLSALVGAALVGSALSLFHRAGTPPEPWRPTTEIADTGIYARTRNPMYLGMACIHLALGIAVQSPSILLMLVPTLIIIDRAVIAREEAYLLRRFGDSYVVYKSKVRRWI